MKQRILWSLVLTLILLSGTACPTPPPAPPSGPFHDPWTVMPSSELAPLRGSKIMRGIIHAHSPYSHDACDGKPEINGLRNEQCLDDLRSGLCATAQDFAFLTDHADLFADHEYPDVLLWREGDTLIERGGLPVANRARCDDESSFIVAAGTETGMMPIGLEHHVGASPAARHQAYSEVSAQAVQNLRDAGALVFLQHTEGWTLQQIQDLGVDGLEMYNLHQNMMDRMGDVVQMVLTYVVDPEAVPIPELALLAVFEESAADLRLWAQTSATRQVPTILATDVHRNVFNDETYDGDRLDSYRRMSHWFSNYVLVPDDVEVDDLVLKQAIGQGRLYGALDILGYPVGFDFHATAGSTVVEMGGEIATANNVTLHLRAPSVYRLDPTGPQPLRRTLLLRAEGDGWVEVASGDGDLDAVVGPGVYRAEVRLTAHHLTEWLGALAEDFVGERIWVYSNTLRVTP
ncbi:MAG: hypothetical protein ABIJ09_24365 [Pseudomonadota bacterium]